ncbi:MAG TPA: 5-oxoprolinase subunit PxpB [Actinomycetota bacterium]|nr:5-oxoprolinase subunit PxpB [Actinomycetota bacterium]
MNPEPDSSIGPLGDAAVVVCFGDAIDPEIHDKVMSFAQQIDSSPPPGLVEHVPAFTTVTLVYDPLVRSFDEFHAAVLDMLGSVAPRTVTAERDPVEIPVCYGGEHGPDLDFVAAHNDVTPDEVIDIHSGTTYVVYMIGFAPGFPYLGAMSPRIAAPRLDTPRQAVPAGSVGIAGSQTGIYPIATPGGWRLIGRTPMQLFRARAQTPSLLAAGDRVRFVAITPAEYDAVVAARAAP